jgi:hydroxymethylbilane synthase
MITIGSRGSQLALWQARWVESRLLGLGAQCRIEVIKTTGDKVHDVPLAKVGSKGLFTKEIEDALLAESVDVAVHSLKDMPTELPEGLILQAIPEREDVRDVLVGKRLDELGAGARVGTSSLRRAAQLRAARPDLEIESIRGNVDTRIRKLDDGQFAAIMLAAAGLKRLGLSGRITEYVPIEVICPAVGQGALAVETRADEGEGATLCRKLDHWPTRAAVTAERALLRAMVGGCQVPIGAFAEVNGVDLYLRAIVISPEGDLTVRGEQRGLAADADRLGTDLAHELLERGAREILKAVYGAQQ